MHVTQLTETRWYRPHSTPLIPRQKRILDLFSPFRLPDSSVFIAVLASGSFAQKSFGWFSLSSKRKVPCFEILFNSFSSYPATLQFSATVPVVSEPPHGSKANASLGRSQRVTTLLGRLHARVCDPRSKERRASRGSVSTSGHGFLL